MTKPHTHKWFTCCVYASYRITKFYCKFMSLVLEMVNFSIVFTNSILLMHASFYFLKFSDFSIPIMNPYQYSKLMTFSTLKMASIRIYYM